MITVTLNFNDHVLLTDNDLRYREDTNVLIFEVYFGRISCRKFLSFQLQEVLYKFLVLSRPLYYSVF